jgi:hypothetical protein
MNSTRIARLIAKPKMIVRLFLAAIALTTVSSTAFAEPKAYEIVKYKGKAAGLTIALDYGAGYPEASKMRISEAGKTTHFMLDDSGEMHFVADKKTGGDKKIILTTEVGDAPLKVEGTYTSGGKTIAFTLQRM